MQVDRSKVKLAVLKEWITMRITSLLQTEDEIVVSYAINFLEDSKSVR